MKFDLVLLNHDLAQMPALTRAAEILAEMALAGPWAELPKLAQARYGNLLDRISFYLPFHPGPNNTGWRQAIQGFKG